LTAVLQKVKSKRLRVNLFHMLNEIYAGKIMRMTIPRSQGKQAYYDARKSGWGDIFPHPPKNPPQERHQPQKNKRDGDAIPPIGADIGKRSKLDKKRDRASYDALSETIKEKRERSRRDRLLDRRE
jgi:ribosomal protein RSM22 (predicted rRNA methylase)